MNRMPAQLGAAPHAGCDTFRLVIAYEDYDCGIRAMQVHNQLLGEWDPLGQLELVLWKFEPLGMPDLAREAVRDLAHADMLILSIAGSRPLPAEARRWIESWRGQLPRDGIGLVFLDDPAFRHHPEALATRAYLEEVACASGMDFIAPTRACAPPPAPLHHSALTVLDSAHYRDRYVNHWGINE